MLPYVAGIVAIVIAMMFVGAADMPQETLDLVNLVLWVMLVLMFLPFIIIGVMFVVAIIISR